MKNKIGILTYHNAVNYGAAFQAIALYQFLCQNIPKYEYEFIDYKCPAIIAKDTFNYILKLRISGISKIKRIIGLSETNKKKRKFELFFDEVKFSKSVQENEIASLAEEYYKIIIGSDQLWNFKLNKGDMTYLLPMVHDTKKILTYATSVGTNQIDHCYMENFKHCISSYGTISVREQLAKDLTYSISGREAKIVLDPVFLLDKKVWEKYIQPYKGNSFIVQYLFRKENLQHMNALIDQLHGNNIFIKKIAGGIRVSDYLNKRIQVCITDGPKEFLNDIYNAEFIFTDSFHCVAMSIIFHKPFVVFLSGDAGADSRIVELVHKSGLDECIYRENMIINRKMNWNAVDRLLNHEKNESRTYLINALDQ